MLPTPRADPRDATARTPRDDWRPSLSEALGGLTSSPAASPARAQAPQANVRDSSTPSPFCGARCGASLAKFDPATYWSKTSPTYSAWLRPQGSLLDPCGEPWSGTWPRSGSVTSDGTVFPLRPSAPRTSVTGCSAWLSVPTTPTRREPLSPQYAAGLLDGEGCISMAKHHRGRTFTTRVAIHMAAPGLPVLKAMLATYGGHLSQHRKETEDWRATWQWVVTSRADVTRCLSDVLPYLIVKADQATLALSWMTLLAEAARKTNGNVDWTPEIIATATRVRDEMKRLNHRGPSSSTARPDTTLLTLLPTPMARTQSGTQVSGDSRTGGPMLQGESVRMLPTPRARVDKEHGPDGKHWGELRPVVESLSTGATISPPSPDGKPSTGLRLNPSFVGWMMGTTSCRDCGREWTDPDCPHSVTAFMFTSDGSPVSTS